MFKKRFLKGGGVKVEFVVPEEVAHDADSVYLVGDFNNWDETATPMQQLKSGSFKTTLNLDPDREYQFRYLVNGKQWHNDWDADKYVANPFSGDNSVVSTYRTNGDA
jgi:1,4-alpha-glucan branching enzyme